VAAVLAVQESEVLRLEAGAAVVVRLPVAYTMPAHCLQH